MDHVVDKNDSRKWFYQVPNIIDEMGLSKLEHRLLSHYLRVGTCTEGLETTSKKCGMSTGAISEARRALSQRGLITYTRYNSNNGIDGYRITVNDLWEDNAKYFLGDKSVLEKYKTSAGEGKTSAGEEKNTLIKNTGSKKTKKRKLHNVMPSAAALLEESDDLDDENGGLAAGGTLETLDLETLDNEIWNVETLIASGNIRKGEPATITGYISQYLVAVADGLKSPVGYAVKNSATTAPAPFGVLASMPPAKLATVLAYVAGYTSIHTLNGEAPTALAFEHYLKAKGDVPGRTLRAINELGLTGHVQNVINQNNTTEVDDEPDEPTEPETAPAAHQQVWREVLAAYKTQRRGDLPAPFLVTTCLAADDYEITISAPDTVYGWLNRPGVMAQVELVARRKINLVPQ